MFLHALSSLTPEGLGIRYTLGTYARHLHLWHYRLSTLATISARQGRRGISNDYEVCWLTIYVRMIALFMMVLIRSWNQ